ncbi:DUF3265 domain-containing protein, partial [Vibrio vulnificus]|nr:DUF3265 domain-containing protein [Vibrio vulnificus]
CSEFCGENDLRKVGLCGIHPLTQRYGSFNWLGLYIKTVFLVFML